MDEQEQQARIERAEKAVSFLARLAVSLVLPLWGLVMLILGVEDGSGWWIGTGVAVCAVGILFLAGGPLADAFLREP